MDSNEQDKLNNVQLTKQDVNELNQMLSTLQALQPFTIQCPIPSNSQFDELSFAMTMSGNRSLGYGYTTDDTIHIYQTQDKSSEPLIKVEDGYCKMLSPNQNYYEVANKVGFLPSPEGSFQIVALDQDGYEIAKFSAGFNYKCFCFSKTPQTEMDITNSKGRDIALACFNINKDMYKLTILPNDKTTETEKILVKILSLGYMHNKIKYLQTHKPK